MDENDIKTTEGAGDGEKQEPVSSDVFVEDDLSVPTGEMVDREEIKAQKEKKKQEKAKERARNRDAISVALNEGYLGSKRKRLTKRRLQILGGVLGLCFLYWIYTFLFTGYKAGVTYGICKAYLEQDIRFPMYLKYISLTDFGDSVRIWYKRLDSFGGHRVESIRCYYKYDEAIGRSIVEKVVIERREEPEYKIDRFNRILPVVLKNLPDLTWPYPESDPNLDAIEEVAKKARKPIL